MIGKVLGNRYEIISQLGGGGMALVYKGRDTLLNREVTVKMLRPEYTGDEEFVARFRKEAQAVAKLSHPNIVSVYDVGQEENIHYIVMEYIEGSNLKQVIKEHVRIPVNQAVDIARQICAGLQDAHEHGIVHRDIKPHNILVTDTGKVKVTDFGIAQMKTSITLTNSGTIVGSVHYFSPEQARGGITAAKSDIYSVGVVLYEMVTGKVPFEGDTPIAIALKHIQDQPLPPSRINPQVTPELERIILRAMEKDVTMRYMSAGDMARDLRKLLPGKQAEDRRVMDADEFATRVMNGPVIITKEEDGEPAYRKKKKRMRPMAKMVIIAMILGLIAGAVYGLNNMLMVADVRVPDVKDMLVDDALKALQEKKLESKIQLRHDPEIEPSHVISQDPGADEMVKENTKVTLVVSQGPMLVTVPDVVKKELEAARIELENAEFQVDPAEDFSEEVPVGSVISQSPKGDTQAVKGSTVSLVVSKGTEAKPVDVPGIVGLPLEEGRARLESVKLKLSQDMAREQSNDFISGYIIRQEPAAGTQMHEGEEVKVTVSTGPGPEAKTAEVSVEIPDDNMVHTVKIVVEDVMGTRTALEPKEYNPGDKFTQLVTYYRKGKIRVYVDNKIIREKLVD